MRKASRTRLRRLPEKLLLIRSELGLSQNEMLVRLGFAEELFRSNISQYELGRREPPLPVLLEYARTANVLLEVLVDDDLDMPKELPSPNRHEGIRRTREPGRKR